MFQTNRWGYKCLRFRQIDGQTMETVTDFIFLGSKISVDGDCSHEIKKDTCSLEEKQWQT